MRLKAPRVSFNTLGRYPSLRSEAVKKSTTGVILRSASDEGSSPMPH